jgi:UDP-glucose-4-epimerase GalE
MRSVLVTGGAGYIGSHTALALAEAGYRPIVYDNLSHGHRWAVQWGPLIEGDLSDRDKLTATILDYDVSAVLHFASFIFVGESMTDPGKYFANNVGGTVSLLEAVRTTGVKHVVFSSTAATYGMPEIVPITEDAPKEPINTYGESKLMAERLLYWYDQIFAVRSVALRYFNAAGADPRARIGEAHDPETHLIPLILDAVAGRRSHIGVYGTDYPTPDGTAIRDYIHVCDLAEAHVKALEYLIRGGASTAVNLGTGTGYSVKEVIGSVERITGKAVPRRYEDRRAGDPPSLVADADRGARLLDWTPRQSDIDMIVKSAWHWHQSPAHG